MAGVDVITDVLAGMGGQPRIGSVAHELASAGVPVFPCVPGGKRPLTSRGFLDASHDPARVAAWWDRWPRANLAVPTGAGSGLVVVDVDVHGADGYRSFERARRAGLVSGWRLLVASPSGGLHAYYPGSSGVEQRSWQAAAAGVDFRGDGGYIIIPPSALTRDGTSVSYRVHRIGSGPASGVDAAALRDFLDPRPVPQQRSPGQGMGPVEVSRLAAWVAGRGEGERNAGLFWAACRLAEQGIVASDALDALQEAAEQAGLGGREITATIRSAYRTSTSGGSTPSRRRPPLRVPAAASPSAACGASSRGL